MKYNILIKMALQLKVFRFYVFKSISTKQVWGIFVGKLKI